MALIRYVPLPGATSFLRRAPAVLEIMYFAAQNAAEQAQAIAPVLTGEYRASIHAELDEEGASIVADDYKAVWIEFGTGEPGPTPAFAPLRRGAEAAGLVLLANRG